MVNIRVMSVNEQKVKARVFKEEWQKKAGNEKQEAQQFWNSLLSSVFGVEDITNFIRYEVENQEYLDSPIKYIDAYIAETKVLIEQKSSNIDLRKAYKQSNGSLLTPYQQAKQYAFNLPVNRHPKWIVISNFKTFLIYNMETPWIEPEELLLENFEDEYYRLGFLVDVNNNKVSRELSISVDAGKIVGQLYNEFSVQYGLNSPNIDYSKSLNKLCVRLVFCLYADSSGVFGHIGMFKSFIQHYSTTGLRQAILSLFKVLDEKPEDRDPYLEEELAQFPYVNGGLFTGEDKLVPPFTDRIREILINQNFNWAEISPTIFGAVFESTLNPETRRQGGIHYTSLENIHKVIDPLFLNDLNEEFKNICSIRTDKTRTEKLKAFQSKLGTLKFLDPACGSGNFLTETYLCLRKLENECIRIINGGIGGQNVFTDFFDIKVSIGQFYGIEINDFAVSVAKTALWIAESQMFQKTCLIANNSREFLPLKSYSGIVEGNALTMNWEDVVSKHELNYIIGNPPFIGARVKDNSRKSDLKLVWGNVAGIGDLDYVSGWYKKCADYMKDTDIESALVSSNSITQGQQVPIMWQPLMRKGIVINFAYRSFKWINEAENQAHVHCVIIGFSYKNNPEKLIYAENVSIPTKASHINAYLLDVQDIFISKRKNPISNNIPKIRKGNQFLDNQYYLFDENEKNNFIRLEPNSKNLFKKLIGAEEFIHNTYRHCLLLRDASPNSLNNMPHVLERMKLVREYRLQSNRDSTRRLAETPTKFGMEYFPEHSYFIIPEISQGTTREYIPMGFVSPDILPNNRVNVSDDISIYHFGVLTSKLHMIWVDKICGRLELDPCYSISIVYNNFPWCSPTDTQKKRIEQTAQAILDVRAKYPDCSLADLYNPLTMPDDLRKAHKENDRAVLKAYGLKENTTEEECLSKLFMMYQKLTN